MLHLRIDFLGRDIPAFTDNFPGFRKYVHECGNGLVSGRVLTEEKWVMRAKQDENLKLAENLRWLKSQGTPLSTLAKRADIATSTLSAWASGQSPTDHSALLRLSRVLKCSLERLLFGNLSLQLEPAPTNLEELFSGRFILDVKIRKPGDGE